MTDDKAKQIAASIGAARIGKKQRKKFLRYEWFKCKKLGLNWRRPVGLHSKMRQGRKGKPPQVNAGFGHARAIRGFVNGAVPAVLIQNMADLERVAAKHKTVMIAAGIGAKKIGEIANRAEQLGIVILNKSKIKTAQHRAWTISKQREAKSKAKTETKAEAKPAIEPKAEMKPEVKEKLRQEVKAAVKKEAAKVGTTIAKQQVKKG